MDPQEKPSQAEVDDDAEDVDMEESYIDRLQYEVENDGEEDDSDLDIVGEDGGQENALTEHQYESDDESPSDDDFEYDSDEDTTVNILAKGYKARTMLFSGGDLSEENKELLLWRLRKEESFSDWSIEVSFPMRGRDSKKLYHVHRSALAAGPKKSGYFETLFKSDNFKESSDNTSKVKLSEDAAKCFPDFLDYLYSPSSESHRIIKSDNWRSLQYLADYFLVPKLNEAINDFVKEDLRNVKHLQECLSDLRDADDNQPMFLHRSVTRAIAEMILSIEGTSSISQSEPNLAPATESPLLYELPPAMFLQVITLLRSSKDIKNLSSYQQGHICNLVIDYIKTHQSILNHNYFTALTRELYFPDDVKIAGPLAVLLFEIMEDNDWEVCSYGIEDVCSNVLSKFFASRSGPSIQEMFDFTEKVPHNVLQNLFIEAVSAKRTIKQKELNISCKIMDEALGVPVGSIVKISCETTDSVNRIRYLIGRYLNVLPASESRSISVRLNGSELDEIRMLSKAGINSNTTLEIMLSSNEA